METFAILGMVFGIFGLIAFGQLNDLKKEMNLLRIKIDELNSKR